MMMMSDTLYMGVEDGPVSPLNYKRAVIKSAPREFTVEVLCPAKQGSHYSYGVKVCPVIRSKGSSDSRSTSSYSEYEIWRRWEDCLDFQETLENEYGKLSRQKVKVLRRAATGKRRNNELDGPYNLHNAAASFESLPEGPDPREVVVDVHKLVPVLTRKGSLFRVSRTTIKQRGDEFAAMIQALFDASEDTPVLLQELRNCASVRDFFAIWRRDQELLKKSGKDVSRLFHSNHSMSSLATSFSLSTFSTASTTATSPISSAPHAAPSSPGALSRHSMFTRSPTAYYADAVAPTPASAPPNLRRFIIDPTTSSRSNASQKDSPWAALDTGSSSIMFTDELLLQDEPGSTIEGASQSRLLSRVSAPRSAPLVPSPAMRPHPLDSRVQYPIPENQLPRPQPRARSNSATIPGHRNARIFVSDPGTSLRVAEVDSLSHQSGVIISPNRRSISPHAQQVEQVSYLSPISSQSSSQSLSASSSTMNRFSVTSSISSYTQASKRSSGHGSEFSFDPDSCGDIDITVPSSSAMHHTLISEIAEARDFEPSQYSRDSVSSFASFRTEASADGALPFHLRPQVDVRGVRAQDSTWTLENGVQSPFKTISEAEDLPNAYFTDFVDGARFSVESLDKQLPGFFSHGGKHSISSMSSMGSFGTESPSSWSPRDDAFAIKAVYNDCVIVLRAEHGMSLATIRQRIRERLALHDCVPSDDFVLAYLPPRPSAVNGVKRRGRSNSVASSTSDVSQLRLLQTENDWRAAAVTCNGKATLRVLDDELQP